MQKIKGILIILILLLISGCERGKQSISEEIREASAAPSVSSPKESERIHEKYPDEDFVDDQNFTPLPEPSHSAEVPAETPIGTPVTTPDGSPETGPDFNDGKKLDFKALAFLDTKKHGWGVGINKQQKPPYVSQQTKKLILQHDAVYLGDTTKKELYLTFDEGYENGYTPMILDTLKENDVKAIFFVTAPYFRKHPELVRRMIDEGHLIGSHTITHPSLPEIPDESLEKELVDFEKEFYDKFNVGIKYLRPPKGEYSEKTLAAAKQLGFKTVFWSFAFYDYDVNKLKGADYAFKMITEHMHNGAVLLIHAVSRDNAEALDRVIKELVAQGYIFKTFDL
ncbi:MAG: polysaccharide deacetylase family protein [Clostridia bacterium]|nr:polysaccharide deacetylase family protein [Clostridia bacterium]